MLCSVALPVLNLSHAERDGFDKLIAPCLACLSRFKAANIELEHDADLKEKTHQVFNYKYQGKVKVYHPLEVFLEIGLDRIREKIRKKLSGLEVACYYGYVLTRPPKIAQFDNVEDPQSMDSIVSTLGATPIGWSFKTERCGVSMTLMGFAFGAFPKEVGVQKLITSPQDVLGSVGLM